MAGIFGQEHTLLRRRVPAADDIDVAARKKFTVASGAVGHAPSLVILFSLKPDLAGIGPCGQQDPQTTDIAPVRVDHLDIAFQVQARHAGQTELRAEGFGLFPHGLGQGSTRSDGQAGIVDDGFRNGDLAAEFFFFQDQDTVPRPSQVEGASQSGRSPSDNHDIVQIFCCCHGQPPCEKDRPPVRSGRRGKDAPPTPGKGPVCMRAVQRRPLFVMPRPPGRLPPA